MQDDLPSLGWRWHLAESLRFEGCSCFHAPSVLLNTRVLGTIQPPSSRCWMSATISSSFVEPGVGLDSACGSLPTQAVLFHAPSHIKHHWPHTWPYKEPLHRAPGLSGLGPGGRGRKGERNQVPAQGSPRRSFKIHRHKIAVCMDLFPFGNYRKLQAPTTVIQIATLDD